MTSRNKQRGFLSLDMAIGLAVFSVVVTLAIAWQIKQMDSQDYRIVADQQRTISEALAKYLKDNYRVVQANATATVPVQITVPMLVNTHYLPAGFSPTNAYGQTILGLARKPNPNQLEVIVVTSGGQTIPEMGIRTIAENLGGPGGFISSANPNIVQGVRGGWQVALSNYAIAPGPGHTASALFLMDGALANDYLYRNAVPNHPELNKMNTDIAMGNHNINNAGNITASGNITANADIKARNVIATANVNAATASITGDTTTGGWFRTRGDTGWYSEKWGGGIYQNSPNWVQVYNNKNFSTGGELRGGKITSTGKITAYDRIQTNEYLSLGGIATEGQPCSDRTLIAKSSAGIMLSCQQGVWRSSGGGKILTGFISHGQQIPLPSGSAVGSCTWSVSDATNVHGGDPTRFGGNYAYANSNRIVTCGEYDMGMFFAAGMCSYVIACN